MLHSKSFSFSWCSSVDSGVRFCVSEAIISEFSMNFPEQRKWIHLQNHGAVKCIIVILLIKYQRQFQHLPNTPTFSYNLPWRKGPLRPPFCCCCYCCCYCCCFYFVIYLGFIFPFCGVGDFKYIGQVLCHWTTAQLRGYPPCFSHDLVLGSNLGSYST